MMAAHIVACVALASGVAFAEGVALDIGGYAGMTSTNIETTYNSGNIASSRPHEGATGLSLAAYVRYTVLRPLSVEADVMYAMKGYDVSPQVHIHYIEVPILARLDLFPASVGGTGFLYVGLAPAIRAACTESGTAFDNDVQAAYSYDGACDDAPLPRTPSRFDLGRVLGGGFGWKTELGVFELHARTVRSLVDVGGRRGGETVNLGTYFLLGFGRRI